MQKESLIKLAAERSNPSVSISLNTHRTHPDNAKDVVLIKNLCTEAENRLNKEFKKRDIEPLLQKLKEIPDEIKVNYNIESLHIFLSNTTKEIIRTVWKTPKDVVHINDSFAIRPLIKAYNRAEDYLIMLLSQSGVRLFEALNDAIVDEIENDDFPFPENPHYLTNKKSISDGKQVDNMVREFLNKVDKALVKIHNQSDLHCIVVCTEDNFSRLMQVADRLAIYLGYANIDYNNTSEHFIVSQAFSIIKDIQKKRRIEAIKEMKEAVSQAKVYTDLQDIYRAAKEGRADLLITQNNYIQPVKMKDELSFDLIENEDATDSDVIDDIISNIAWEVISKKGRAVFADKDELKEIGNIALKVRY